MKREPFQNYFISTVNQIQHEDSTFREDLSTSDGTSSLNLPILFSTLPDFVADQYSLKFPIASVEEIGLTNDCTSSYAKSGGQGKEISIK